MDERNGRGRIHVPTLLAMAAAALFSAAVIASPILVALSEVTSR